MAKTKKQEGTRPFLGEDIDDYKKPKNKGKVEKVGGKTLLTTGDGKVIRLMNPREKAKKAAYELQTGVRYTNLGQVKTDNNGRLVKLSPKQKSWRAGYLAANTDCAKAYKAKQGKRGK